MPLLLMTCTLCLLSCSKDNQLEDNLPLTAEDEVLYQHGLLEGTTLRKQTATRVFLDAALQSRPLETDGEECANNCGSQTSVLDLQIAQLRQKDNLYENRLRSIFKKIEDQDSYSTEWFEPFTCPESLSRTDERPSYCQWEEEKLLSILVNTAEWSIQNITLINANTEEVLASSTEGTSFTESSYVLHRLKKASPEAIASGTVVALVLTRIQSNGLEETVELFVEVA